VFAPDVDGPSAEPVSAHLPAAWRDLFGERAGSARFTRRFNRPTNLDPNERVWIVLTDVPEDVRLQVNGRPLAAESRFHGEVAFDATSSLQDHNLLEIEIRHDPTAAPGESGGLHHAVIIEITQSSRGTP
jgi:hypothetical protein